MGVSPDSTRSRAAPARVSVARSRLTSGARPTATPASMRASTTRIDVGRPRARQPRDGVERCLGEPDDAADGGEELLGPHEVGLGRPRPGGQARDPGPHRGRRVGHGPEDGGGRREPRFEPRQGHPRHDRQDTGHPDARQRPARLLTDGRLHGDHRRRRGDDVDTDLDARKLTGELGSTVRGRLDDHDVGRSPPCRHEPVHEGPTHTTTTDDEQPRHHRGHATERVDAARPEEPWTPVALPRSTGITSPSGRARWHHSLRATRAPRCDAYFFVSRV